MIKKGDTEKVIAKTRESLNGEMEYIPIGTICRVTDVDPEHDCIGIIPIINPKMYGEYWYNTDEGEKGHLEWVKDVEDDNE